MFKKKSLEFDSQLPLDVSEEAELLLNLTLNPYLSLYLSALFHVYQPVHLQLFFKYVHIQMLILGNPVIIK